MQNFDEQWGFVNWTIVKSTVFKDIILRWLKKLRIGSKNWYVVPWIDVSKRIRYACVDALEQDGVTLNRNWVTIPDIRRTAIDDNEPVIPVTHVNPDEHGIGKIYTIQFSENGDVIDAIGEITGKNVYRVGIDDDAIYLAINDNVYPFATSMNILSEKLPDFNSIINTEIRYLTRNEMDIVRNGGFYTFTNNAGYKFRITKAAFKLMGVDRPDLEAKYTMGYGFYELDSQTVETMSNSIVVFDDIFGVVIRQDFMDIGFSAFSTGIAMMY